MCAWPRPALKPKVDAARAAWVEADKKYKAFLAKPVGGGKTVQDLLKEYFDAKKVRDDLIAEIMGPYLALSDTNQGAFDQKVGIDRHANPAVGEAYTISSGGANPARQLDVP